MSYCRMGPDSDVYLIATFDNNWNCFCQLPCVVLDSEEDVLAHLQNHVRAGDKVPDYAIERIQDEITLRSVSNQEGK